MIEEILISCLTLPKIPSDAADAYIGATDKLLDNVNGQLEADPKIKELIGRNPIELMRENHRNHATFMATVFKINSFELLARTVPWVYRAYHARGFSYDYFPAELVAWQVAIHECLASPDKKTEILAVYKWMVQHHEDMIKLSLSGEGLSFSIQREANEMQQIFLSLLLHGDTQGCLKLVGQSILTADDLKHFYLDVVWPAMTRIGYLWESNQISVAEEHLATAIVGRVMASLYPRFALFETTRGKAIVTAGPNEFHEVGARMVADFMEMDGWDVTYLGANTPTGDLLKILKQHKPFVVALSVATVFNLDNARQIIQMINEDRETSNIKVMVGGLAFNGMPQLWQNIGADGYAADAQSALRVTDDWWISENSNHA
jgi:methanogenic corrinoid protein MtbC1